MIRAKKKVYLKLTHVVSLLVFNEWICLEIETGEREQPKLLLFYVVIAFLTSCCFADRKLGKSPIYGDNFYWARNAKLLENSGVKLKILATERSKQNFICKNENYDFDKEKNYLEKIADYKRGVNFTTVLILIAQ